VNIVFDTSVLIAAFYKPLHGPSFSKDVYDYAVDYGQVFLSPDILKEFRAKCATKLKMPPGDIERLVALLRTKTLLHTLGPDAPPQLKTIPLRDPDDRHILHLALEIHADVILTWDKDLLTLKKAGAARILSPREFWDGLS
jgi:putative PIN family toxin of toxin-antitoxin system